MTHLFYTDVPGVWVPADVDDGVAHLQRPGVHDILDGHGQGQRAVSVASYRQVAPEVVLNGGAVLAVDGGR